MVPPCNDHLSGWYVKFHRVQLVGQTSCQPLVPNSPLVLYLFNLNPLFKCVWGSVHAPCDSWCSMDVFPRHRRLAVDTRTHTLTTGGITLLISPIPQRVCAAMRACRCTDILHCGLKRYQLCNVGHYLEPSVMSVCRSHASLSNVLWQKSREI